MASTLLVNEIFGPTIQGEGPAAGRPCAFVRFAICPLHCRWCDTSYTWAFSDMLAKKHQSQRIYAFSDEVHVMEVQDVVKQVVRLAGYSEMVVISGGEPLVQSPPRLQGVTHIDPEQDDPLGSLVRALYHHNISVHIETAGIRSPSPMVRMYTSQFVVSPKLASSGNKLESRRRVDVLRGFAGMGASTSVDFKFVITSEQDFDEVDEIVRLCDITPHRVWVMPEGTTPDKIHPNLVRLAEPAIKRGYNVSTRLHVDIWGDERGH